MRRFSTPISRIAPLPEEAPRLRRLGNVHWGPLGAAIALALIGLATVSSASAELGSGYLHRQAVWLVLGTIALVVVFLIDYHVLADLAPIFYGIALVLLIVVLFAGREVGGARSWLGIGPFGGQPSELAKLATILALTRYLGRLRQPMLRFRQLLVVGALVAVPVILIAFENDHGSAAMFVPIVVAMTLVAGVERKHIVVAVLLAATLATTYVTVGLRPHQRARIVSYLSPDSDPLGSGYQVRQSKIAVGSGGWVGRGYGQGTQSQLRFLPERHTDFVMAVLAEEWGFVGVVTVLGLYAFFFGSCVRIALRSRDRSGILLIVGLIAFMAFHVLYNTGMVVGLLPITGIPLPFLSYGGSFTLVNFIATGLVLNVDHRRYVNR